MATRGCRAPGRASPRATARSRRVEPGFRAALDGLLVQLFAELRLVADAGQEAAQDPAGGGGLAAVDRAQQGQDVFAQCRRCRAARGCPRPGGGRRRRRARRGSASAGRSRSCWCRPAARPVHGQGGVAGLGELVRGGAQDRVFQFGAAAPGLLGHVPQCTALGYGTDRTLILEEPCEPRASATTPASSAAGGSTARSTRTWSARELTIIRDDLHCTAVRLIGGDLDRMEHAARDSGRARAGGLVLAVPLGPHPGRDPVPARRLRRRARNVSGGGRRGRVRHRGRAEPVQPRLPARGRHRGAPGRAAGSREQLIAGLSDRRSTRSWRRAVAAVRARFGGAVTYAAIPLERVDWEPFDIISVDAVPLEGGRRTQFRDGVRALVAGASRSRSRSSASRRTGERPTSAPAGVRDRRVRRARAAGPAERRVRARRGGAGAVPP